MIWKVIADFVVILHTLWVLLVIFLPLWAWNSQTGRSIHLWILWTGLILFVGFDYCPLTTIESWLRLHYDPTIPYPGKHFSVILLERISNLPLNTTIILALFFLWAVLWTLLYRFFKPLGSQNQQG